VGGVITLVEHGCLTTAASTETLDERAIDQAAFDWLAQATVQGPNGAVPLFRRDGSRRLRVGNHVGVVETPGGTVVEILPKHHDDMMSVAGTRRLLGRMIEAALDLPAREVGEAHLSLFDAPLSEWVARRFLDTLDRLVKRGLRSDYLRVEEEERYLRGQLDLSAQLRQPPGRAHRFRIRHDVFSPDRPENRLLKSALALIGSRTRNPTSWRLARELLVVLRELPPSANPTDDFKRWRSDRLMAHYEPVRPWCELVLGRRTPLSVPGHWRGISMLFPMEKLFERYVEAALRRSLPSNAVLTSQAASRYLCQYEEKGFFQLRPDLSLTLGDRRWILDAKWKRLDASDRDNRFGLSQSDFYQMFAYGQKYLDGVGDLVLIYPRISRFSSFLGPFGFSDSMRLWALPFDLDARRLCVPDVGSTTAFHFLNDHVGRGNILA
jgi:5-methylcytosine-specific restriction enzyme subunit McrC